jgi:hypothetical protein
VPTFQISEQEQDALSGLPWPVQILYYGLRRRMDYATGRVGAVHGISWQALREDLWVDPHSGIKFEFVHRETVRRYAAWLERVGLIEMKSIWRSRRLIFHLRLAITDQLVRKQPDKNPTRQPDKEPDKVTSAQNKPDLSMENRRKRRAEIAQADKEPDKGLKVQPDKHPRSDVNPPTTTLHGTVVGVVDNLIWPNCTPSEKATWTGMLNAANLGTRTQLVLDELVGASRKTEIQSKAGYLRALIQREKAGIFIPEKAYDEADDRERRKQNEARLEEAMRRRP